MRIIGVRAAGGRPVFAATLPHGEDPRRLAWAQGYRLVRPLSALGSGGELTLIVQVSAHRRERHDPTPVLRAVDADLELSSLTAPPPQRQRVAAYAIVVSQRGLLATQFSDLTAVPGLWGLPGGGIDPGESPSQAVTREVAEETGQLLRITQLLDIHTDHWIGRAPSGEIEDFHAVRIIYAGRCDAPTDPVVHDLGGTTESAAWLDSQQWPQQSWSNWTKTILDRHLATLSEDLA